MMFDAENRLTSISNTEKFTYDGNGRRATKTLNGTTTYYNYSGSTLLGEDTVAGANNPSSAFYSLVYGYAADGLRSAESSYSIYTLSTSQSKLESSGVFDFLYDPQGNLVQRLDSWESGLVPGVDQINSYSAYGASMGITTVSSPAGYVTNLTTAKLPTAVGFGGQYGYYTDPEYGLILLGARYYDPGVGRFLNRDPHRLQRWGEPVCVLWWESSEQD